MLFVRSAQWNFHSFVTHHSPLPAARGYLSAARRPAHTLGFAAQSCRCIGLEPRSLTETVGWFIRR